jgi:hypothetical protein
MYTVCLLQVSVKQEGGGDRGDDNAVKRRAEKDNP